MFQTFQSLRIRPFAFLWSGQTVSRLGDGLFQIAIVWWVLDKTGSAAALGFVEVAVIIPKLIFLLIGGVIADRLPRLRLMLTSDSARGILLAIIALLTITKQLEVWHLYIAGFIFGFVDAFFQPAYAAIVPDVVPVESLPSANSMTALSGQLAGIFGPSIGGAIVGAGGAALAFGLDGVSFFVAATCVLPILGLIKPRVRTDDAPHPSMIGELREGFVAIRRSPFLWVTITAAAFGNVFFGGGISVAFPALMKLTLKSSAESYGAVLTIFSIGAIVGAVLTSRIGKAKRRGLLTYAGFMGAGIAIGLTGLATAIWMVALGAFIAGIALSAGSLLWVTLMQEIVPPELLGRVSSVDQFGSFILLPLSYGLIGFVINAIGAPITLLGCGLLGAGLFGLGLLHPGVREQN